MKSIDLMKTKEDRMMGGTWMYIFYGDAKDANIRMGDLFHLTVNGVPMDDLWEAVEYVSYRSDINRRFSGFRCTRAN